jgi:hypothetical protein
LRRAAWLGRGAERACAAYSEYIQQLFNEVLLSVGGTLFLLQGGAVTGVRVTYVLAAANFFKVLSGATGRAGARG